MYHILYIHSSVVRQLGYLRFLVTVNNAAMKIHVQVFVEMFVVMSLGCIPRSGIAASYGNCLTSGGPPLDCLQSGYPILHPTSRT